MEVAIWIFLKIPASMNARFWFFESKKKKKKNSPKIPVGIERADWIRLTYLSKQISNFLGKRNV